MTADSVEATIDAETAQVKETPADRSAAPTVDSHDQKPKLLNWKLYIPSIDLRIPYWCIWIVGLFVGLLLGWSFSHSWGASQWGPVAAWFGGILTATAVTISMWQALDAKKKTLQDRKDADKRQDDERKRHERELEHAALQLERSEQRHREQLEVQARSQSRIEQMQSVKETCIALNRIYISTLNFTSEFRFLKGDEELNRFLDLKADWNQQVVLECQSIQLALIGTQDAQIIEFSDTALSEIDTLRKELISPVPAIIDWTVVDNMTDRVHRSVKLITSWATATMQPSYLPTVSHEQVWKYCTERG
ncbi:hypothetical protein RQCS_62020 (plasmid) [Rhodococcus qingshengii]|uniref:hypothetical protein n=1 Tax=Rhodococcus qingshengii TaxID=334542 RepID=UPI0007E56A2E|nr:hypothetical protein [Rhodococcus qingshengii]BCF86657.1 hypothetical protein RQCS_62020 [Rhodococcus qingshengii]